LSLEHATQRSSRTTSTTRSSVDSPYCRIPEAADYLRCSVRHIYRLLDEQRLQSYLLDGIRLLRYRDLDALMEALPPAPRPTELPSARYAANAPNVLRKRAREQAAALGQASTDSTELSGG